MLTNNYHRCTDGLLIKKGLVSMLTAEEKDTLVARIQQLYKNTYQHEENNSYKKWVQSGNS